MLLPRILCSLSSYSMVLVGNETVIWAPPVKNGLMSCRSGDIMFMRSDSAAAAGTVIKSRRRR
jgi:hypothetical protein